MVVSFLGWWCLVVQEPVPGVVAVGALASLAQLGQFVGVGVQDPAVLWGVVVPAADPAALDPGMQGDLGHVQRRCEVWQPPLVLGESLDGWVTRTAGVLPYPLPAEQGAAGAR